MSALVTFIGAIRVRGGGRGHGLQAYSLEKGRGERDENAWAAVLYVKARPFAQPHSSIWYIVYLDPGLASDLPGRITYCVLPSLDDTELAVRRYAKGEPRCYGYNDTW